MSFLYLSTSTNGEYYKDVVELLSLPNGLTYRFRYDAKYVSPTISNLKDYINKDGYIILKNFEENKTIPVRKFRLKKISEFEQSFVHLDFELYNIPDISEKTINDFSDFHNKNLSKSFFVEANDCYELKFTKPQSNNWKELIEVLQTNEKFNKSIFLKINSIVEVDKGEDKLTSVENNKFILKGGNYFRIEFLHLFSENLFSEMSKDIDKDVDVKMFYSDNVVSSILTENEVKGKYDLNRLYFYCFRKHQRIDSMLVLGGKESQKFYFPKIKIPIRISKSLTREYLIIISTGITLFLAGVAHLIMKYVFDIQDNIYPIILTFIGLFMALLSRLPKE